MIDTFDLIDLLVVFGNLAECKNYDTVSKKMHKSKRTIKNYIHLLEEYYNTILIYNTETIELTEKGREVYEIYKQICPVLDEIMKKVNEFKNN